MSGGTYTSDVLAPRTLGSSPFGGFAGARDISFEKMVRAFQLVQTRWPTPVAPGANEGEEEQPPAYLEWGAPSDFYDEDSPDDPIEDLNSDGFGMPVSDLGGGYIVSEGPFADLSSGGVGGLETTYTPGQNSGMGSTTKYSVGGGQLVRARPRRQQDSRPGVLSYNEIDREVQRIFVFNPKDPEQYVVVERIMSIRFRGPDGKIAKFNLKPPPPPPKPKDPTAT